LIIIVPTQWLLPQELVAKLDKDTLKTVQAAVNKAVEGGAEKKGSKAHNVEDRVSPWGNHRKTLGNHRKTLGNLRKTLGNHRKTLGKHRKTIGKP
jgi:hypothetical protein